MLYQSEYASPLGRLIIVCDQETVKGIWFHDQKYSGGSYDLNQISCTFNAMNKRVTQWLDHYFKKEYHQLDVLVCQPDVTPYRQRVLQVLQSIPVGAKWTYQDVADVLNQDIRYPKTSARAVGGAVSHNPVSIIIPCHRVVGSNGKLTGYAGGLERKAQLLLLET